MSKRMKKPATKKMVVRKRNNGGLNAKASTSVAYSGTPFADRFYTNIKYIDAIQFQGSGIGMNFYQHQIYRANALSDLDYSNAGRNQQPMGYDTLCGAPNANAPYLTYTGYDSVIKVDLINNSSVPAWVCIWPSKETLTPPTATSAFEQSYSVYKVVAGNATTPKTTITHKFNTAKLFGETKTVIGTEDSFSASYNAIPANVWYWNIYLVSVDANSSLNMFSRIEMITGCEFSDRNQLAQS